MCHMWNLLGHFYAQSVFILGMGNIPPSLISPKTLYFSRDIFIYLLGLLLYEICIAHKFSKAPVRGAGVARSGSWRVEREYRIWIFRLRLKELRDL